MSIKKSDLEKMNDLVSKGATIADIARKFKNYDYWNIYWEVEDYSLLGKKRSISNRLKKLKRKLTREERIELVDEITETLNDIYKISKKNGKKLIDIGKVLAK
ncbi:MAG: hypothetical protein JRJ38_16710 [Deltaproteobacteria bacterium]|nr:hypothetical protein [Deltaproteobacteria bacterium]